MGRFLLSRRPRFSGKTRKAKSVDIPATYEDDDRFIERHRTRAIRRWGSFTPGCKSVLISSRNPFEEFHRLFPALPSEEFPLNVYTCALSKDILLQGKMFVSQNWICFYSNIFGYETKVNIEMDRVVEIKREKTAFVVPNAISVQTHNKRFFFCSFLSRETVFRLLSRTWTAAVSKRSSIGSHDLSEEGLDNTDCNDNDTTASLFDLSTEDSPHAICSDIDEVKTSSPIPSDEHSSLFPSVVHISTLQRRNGYNRVSITTKPETKMVRWNTIGDLREIKPSKRRKKQLQFKKEGHELAKGPHIECSTPRYYASGRRWLLGWKRKFAYRLKASWSRYGTLSTLFFFISITIVVLALMSIFLLYKINSLNQIFIERENVFSPYCPSTHEGSYDIKSYSFCNKLQRVNDLLSTNLHEVNKAQDVLRKLTEDLER